MIYLIGGSSKSGKSYISKKIMEEKNIPFFSTDFLLWSLGGDNGLFSYFDKDDKVSPILEEYILKILFFLNKNNQDYVIEGTHITLSLYQKAKSLYPNNIKSIFLGYINTTPLDKYNEIKKYENNDSNKWNSYLSKDEFLNFISDQINESKLLKEELNSKSLDLFYEVNNIEKDYKYIIDKLFEM